MGLSSVIGFASSAADRAVDAYRSRLQAQVEQRRLDSLQFNMLVSASMAAVGMLVDAVALQLRAHALQQAVEEAVAAGDLHAAEALRGQLVAALQDPPASARLLSTLAEYIPALVAQQHGDPARVIEGDVV
jgi:hypothetical protein